MGLRSAVTPIVLACIFGLALAWPLHSPPIEHHGEAREGLVVQAIVDRGEWILPRRNGELPSKPPLFHWLAAAATRGLGFSDGVVRLPSAVAAWGVACVVFALGAAIGDRTTGWLAVGALGGMVPFVTSATEARVDMVFTACVTAALGAFFLWYRAGSPRARLALYAATSAAVLAKGPIGAVLPALAIVVFLLVEGELRRLRALWSGPMMALAVLVDVGWYALATAAGGREFLTLHLWRENWSRLVGNAEFHRVAHGSTLRLPWMLVTQFLPWSLVLGWCALRRVRGTRTDAAERFLHVWWMVVLGVFTVAAGKRPVYLLPAAPALALLAGRALAAVASPVSAASMPSSRVGAWRVSVAQVLVALLVFDLGSLATLQTVRELRTRRRTLVRFAGKVAESVPGTLPLPADASIRASDRMVLAYRLRRLIPSEAAAVPGLPYLVPAAARVSRWCEGATLLAESGDGANDVAVMRAPAVGAGRRGDALCTVTPGQPADSGGLPPGSAQHLAGSERRLLVPLGEPVPAPVP